MGAADASCDEVGVLLLATPPPALSRHHDVVTHRSSRVAATDARHTQLAPLVSMRRLRKSVISRAPRHRRRRRRLLEAPDRLLKEGPGRPVNHPY